MRTKNQIRGSKQKGSGFEYSCRDSLIPAYPDILITKQLGFVSGYDLISKKELIVWECKRHKGFSWNELVKWYEKLEKNSPKEYSCILLFKANHQPCLIMYRRIIHTLHVETFEDYYGYSFIKHTGKQNV